MEPIRKSTKSDTYGMHPDERDQELDIEKRKRIFFLMVLSFALLAFALSSHYLPRAEEGLQKLLIGMCVGSAATIVIAFYRYMRSELRIRCIEQHIIDDGQ